MVRRSSQLPSESVANSNPILLLPVPGRRRRLRLHDGGARVTCPEMLFPNSSGY